MKALNKETAAKTQRPERIIQFGEGNFLRAFVDWIIYNMNEKLISTAVWWWFNLLKKVWLIC